MLLEVLRQGNHGGRSVEGAWKERAHSGKLHETPNGRRSRFTAARALAHHDARARSSPLPLGSSQCRSASSITNVVAAATASTSLRNVRARQQEQGDRARPREAETPERLLEAAEHRPSSAIVLLDDDGATIVFPVSGPPRRASWRCSSTAAVCRFARRAGSRVGVPRERDRLEPHAHATRTVRGLPAGRPAAVGRDRRARLVRARGRRADPVRRDGRDRGGSPRRSRPPAFRVRARPTTRTSCSCAKPISRSDRRARTGARHLPSVSAPGG